MLRVLVVGSANLDYVVRAPTIPRPGETVLGENLNFYPGGKGANQAASCKKAGGIETSFLVALGDDAGATVLESSLISLGVDLRIVRSK